MSRNNGDIPDISVSFRTDLGEYFKPANEAGIEDYVIDTDVEAIEFTLRALAKNGVDSAVSKLNIITYPYLGTDIVRDASGSVTRVMPIHGHYQVATVERGTDKETRVSHILLSLFAVDRNTALGFALDPTQPLHMGLVSNDELQLTLVHELQHLADYSDPITKDQTDSYTKENGAPSNLTDAVNKAAVAKGYDYYRNLPREIKAFDAEAHADEYPQMIALVPK